MTSRDRVLLKQIADRLRTDEGFAKAVVENPRQALAKYALPAAQKAAVTSLALSLAVTASGSASPMGIWY